MRRRSPPAPGQLRAEAQLLPHTLTTGGPGLNGARKVRSVLGAPWQGSGMEAALLRWMAPGIFPFPPGPRSLETSPCPHSDYGHQPPGGPSDESFQEAPAQETLPGLPSASKVLYFTIRVTLRVVTEVSDTRATCCHRLRLLLGAGRRV